MTDTLFLITFTKYLQAIKDCITLAQNCHLTATHMKQKSLIFMCSYIVVNYKNALK